MGFMDRLQRAANVFRRSAPDMALVQKQLDELAQDGVNIELKEAKNSKLDVRNTNKDLGYYSAYGLLRAFVGRGKKLAPYGTLERDIFMSEIWMTEPILAGAVYSLCAKMGALNWNITGRRNTARAAARTFAEAAHMGGYDWGGFIFSTAQDFYTTNNGAFWELAHDPNPPYALTDLGHIDSLCCTLTGNQESPMIYNSETTGQTLRFKPGEFGHFASLPSSRERYLGIGYCFVDRAYRAAKLLMGLHDYDSEKLANLPPEGVATVTGLTMDEFTDALKMWLEMRKTDNSLTFPQVLWLIGSQPNVEVKVGFQGFSQIPEAFDRKVVIEQYVQTIALDAGVDVGEFWSMGGGGLGTAGESEIQHMKAKGKGPGEFISTSERHLNAELPDGVDFAFDTQDIEEDANAAAVAKAWIDAYFPLYNLPPKNAAPGGAVATKANPRPDKPNGDVSNPTPMVQGVDTGRDMTNGGGQPNKPKDAEQVITKDQLMRLLVDKGVLPDWMLNDDRTLVTDTDVHISSKDADGDEPTRFVWNGKYLKEERLPAIVINSPRSAAVPLAELFQEKEFVPEEDYTAVLKFLHRKEGEVVMAARNIRGDPIPEKEAVRGAAVTKNTIRNEIKRWRSNPILAPYAPETEAEVEKIVNVVNNAA